MPARKRPRRERTDNWQKIQQFVHPLFGPEGVRIATPGSLIQREYC